MAPKPRTDIPPDVSARTLFEHDHACCICNMRGLAIQIHHIDENPTNHNSENLAVLCLEDHNRTLIKGGFGRQLTAAEVVLYRNYWVQQVRKRRDEAAKVVALANDKFPSSTNNLGWTPKSDPEIIGYLQALPLVRRAAYTAARPRWDSGVGSEMRMAAYEVVDIFEQVLNRLSAFYPPVHFGQPAQEYFGAYIEARYRWHRSIYEPKGIGTGGTMVGEIVAGNVMSDLAALIEQLVEGLYFGYHLADFDLSDWREIWEQASQA